MQQAFLKLFSVLLLGAVLIGCGSDKRTVVPPPTQQQMKLAFSSGRATGDVTGQPYIMNRDGTSVTPLPYSSMPSKPLAITVAPDDSKVLFQMTGSSATDIYTAKLDGTSATKLTATLGGNILPRWSADGKHIVFASTRDQLGGWKIYTMNADGSNQTRLSPADPQVNDIYPTFSPDGTQIVFIGWDTTTAEYGIWTMAVDGSNRKLMLVPHFPLATTAFTPNGGKILWVDGGEIASVNLDGSGRTPLTSSGSQILELMVLGTEVWFTTGQDGNYEVYKMNADGSGQINMTNDPHADALALNVP